MHATRTMTNAQMNWNLRHGFAWFEKHADGTLADEWTMPIWTRAGGWLWNNGREQCYELLIV